MQKKLTKEYTQRLRFLTLCVALIILQACGKCGHCERTTTNVDPMLGTTITITKDDTYCSNGVNASGAVYKQAQINCERWANEKTPVNMGGYGESYKSVWVEDK